MWDQLLVRDRTLVHPGVAADELQPVEIRHGNARQLVGCLNVPALTVVVADVGSHLALGADVLRANFELCDLICEIESPGSKPEVPTVVPLSIERGRAQHHASDGIVEWQGVEGEPRSVALSAVV